MIRGLGIAKGFDKSRANGWYVCVTQTDGRRPKTYFKSVKERDASYAQAVKEVLTFGKAEATVLTNSEKRDMLEMRASVAGTGFTPIQVFHFGLPQAKGASAVTTVGAAAASYLADTLARHEAGKVSYEHWKASSGTVGRFCKVAGKMLLRDCSRIVLKNYLASLPVSPVSKISYAKTISVFFNWCITEDLLLKNPVPKQEFVNRTPSTFTNEQVAEYLAGVAQHEPEYLPSTYLKWYAGIRPRTAYRLNWENIDFEKQLIHIPLGANKMDQPDIVKDLPPYVFQLLAPLRKESGRVTPVGINRQTFLHNKLGYSTKPGGKLWPQDVARHTFASNLYALYGEDSRRVERALLHATSAMLKKHYLAKHIPVASAVAYFGHSVLPSA